MSPPLPVPTSTLVDHHAATQGRDVELAPSLDRRSQRAPLIPMVGNQGRCFRATGNPRLWAACRAGDLSVPETVVNLEAQADAVSA
jgi:hypothetical protein